MSFPTLTGDALGKRVLHRAYYSDTEGVVVAQTEYEVKVRRGFWPFYRHSWVSRVSTREVSP